MNISPLLTTAGWAAIGLLVLYVFFVVSSRAQGRGMRISIVLVVVLLALGIGLNAVGAGLVFIDQFEAGVVISPLTPGGVRPAPLSAGIHWVIPFIESVDRWSIAKQDYTMSGTTGEGALQGNDAVEARSSDGQQVFIDATVRFSVDPAGVVTVRRQWITQDNYLNRFVRPTTRNVIYNTTSRYKVEEIYGAKRGELQSQIQTQLIEEFKKQGLALEAFQLRNVTFSVEYAQSIEQKQIAQQQSEQAKLLVQKSLQEADQLRAKAKGEADAVAERARGDAEAVVIKAKADAEALRLIAEALKTNPDLLAYTYIQKLAPNVGLMLLPAGGNNPFILDLNQLRQQLPPATSTTPVSPTLPTP